MYQRLAELQRLDRPFGVGTEGLGTCERAGAPTGRTSRIFEARRKDLWPGKLLRHRAH